MLHAPVTSLPNIGPARAGLLAKLGVRTVRDLLIHFPRDYEDRRVVTPIDDLEEGLRATVVANVVSARQIRMRGRLSLAEVTFADETGHVRATWFGRGFLAKTFVQGTRVVLTGEVGTWKGLALKNPDYEILSEEDDTESIGRIVPVYPLTEGLSQRMLRGWIADALEACAGALDESALPHDLDSGPHRPLSDALRAIHWPPDFETAESARRRFAYEELLSLQYRILAQRARKRTARACRHRTTGSHLGTLRESLPFTLTQGQGDAVDCILADMEAPSPMQRLLQGDVGCGKTVVALHAVAAAADGGYQTAFMAPTELLAEQHYATLRRALEPFGLRTTLMTGSLRNLAEVREEVARGGAQVVVGTQALFQHGTVFDRLGLVIIDEQHRFGVAQRMRLMKKGVAPDVLHMTATPIPRSLALTVYGAMDLTVIRDLPPGRRPVKTRIIPPEKEADLADYIAREAANGRQTYFVCPLIDESDTKAAQAVTARFEELTGGPLANTPTALVHGRMAPEEKERALARFAAGAVRVLFATSVIEVGIDVPSATIMVIDDAARFGLTQLHQLRGRVGRGTDQSYCFLLGTPRTDEGRRRLDVLVESDNGFDIAEADLALRGPGALYGARQAGLSDLRAADIVRDSALLIEARHNAEHMLRGGCSPHSLFDQPPGPRAADARSTV